METHSILGIEVMRNNLTTWVGVTVLLSLANFTDAECQPFNGKTFHGRIAYSADGNANDPDDWAASPVALAILAECGVKDRLVHFDYNSILPKTDPKWQATHADSVLGAARHYGFELAAFHDCRQNLNDAVNSIAQTINASSADSPLYFIIAGPVEVPYLGIQKSQPEKRQFVYCISHSRWNDGFSSAASEQGCFTYNKRSVIESGVHWVQIQDQNRLLSHSRYGRPAAAEEFRPYFWMRDSEDAKVRFLWERMQVSTRPDPSDAGMAYFLMTGDEEVDPDKLKRLLDNHVVPTPKEREKVRIEAENFANLQGYKLEDRNDRSASHRLNVMPTTGTSSGRISTRFDEPYAIAQGTCDIELRYADGKGKRCRFAVLINGQSGGESFQSLGQGQEWTLHILRDVEIHAGDEIAINIQGPARVDYVQLNFRAREQPKNKPASAGGTISHPRFAVHT